MRFRGHAFVDWDDTIAENIRYFHQTEEANSHLIARLTGHDFAAVRARGQEIDVAVARRIGLVKESLTIAWLECYHEFCEQAGRTPEPEAEAAIRLASRMPYEVRQEILPGSAGVLQWLYESGYEVTIWTAGDHDVQERKIRESGLACYAHRVVAVPDKTPERLQAALEGRELARCFVVGNSLHSDIRPALALGLLAFHIPTETWAFDHSRVDLSNTGYRQVERILDLPAAVTAAFELLDESAG